MTTDTSNAALFNPREIELLHDMIEVQLDHANRCDRVQNRVMAEKQKVWDMERVTLLRKVLAMNEVSAIGQVLTSFAARSEEELFTIPADRLDAKYWHFQWDDTASAEWNIYRFHDALRLYGSFCRRWEEHHNGSGCVVERVRDTYLLPKIRALLSERRVFVVLARTEYEGSDPIRAFFDKAGADAFSAVCDSYNQQRPPAPDTIEDTPENDAEHDAWNEARQEWEQAHPAGKDNVSCDSFPVMEIPLGAATQTQRSDA